MKQALFILVLRTISTVWLMSIGSVVDGVDTLEILRENNYNDYGFGDACADMQMQCSPDMFCAHGACHLRNCENFYLHAPELWTGRPVEEGEEVELECYINEFPETVIPPCQDDMGRPSFPVAVHYACSEYDMSYEIIKDLVCPEYDFFSPEAEGANETRRAIATLNRVCTSKPTPEKQFICYDIAPDTNLTSYFEQYVATIESFKECHTNANPEENTTWVTYGHYIPCSMTARTTYLDDPYTSNGFLSDAFLPLEERNLGERFDPTLVRVRSINTILLETAATNPSSSPQLVWSWLSSIFFVIILVQMLLAVV